jgi:hypothetical protein
LSATRPSSRPERAVLLFASTATVVVIDINGYYAALYATSNNLGLGSGALANNTSSNFNSAAGSNALQTNSTGSYNTATGSSALPVNTGGSFHTATGALAMQFNTTVARIRDWVTVRSTSIAMGE